MSEKTKERKSIAPLFLAAAIVLVLLPGAYVLSWGPAYGLMQHGPINDKAFDTFYWPLIAVSEEVPWIKKALNDYGARWI
jgi:hypothetical protein